MMPQPPRSSAPVVRPGRSLLPLAVACLVVLAAIAPTSADAQAPGTLFGLITDENDQPVADAQLRLTDPESPDFEQTETTDRKGRYRLFVRNAVRTYTLTISKDGHQPLTLNGVKVSANQRTRRNFTLSTAAAATAAGAPAEAPQDNGATTLYNRAVTALNVDDYDSAEALLLEALEADPELSAANAALAKVYLDQERHEQAIEQALIAQQADHRVDDMNQILYASYGALGRQDEADAVLAKMQTADPEKASANLFNEAADLYNQGDTTGAKPILQQVLEVDPDHAKANYLLGMVYAGEQANEEARRHLERFIELAPDDPDAALAKEMLNYL